MNESEEEIDDEHDEVRLPMGILVEGTAEHEEVRLLECECDEVVVLGGVLTF